MNARGVSLVEALVAIAILGIALAAAVPGFLLQAETNTRSEVRTGAVAAAQVVLEQYRLADPSTLPSSGTQAADPVRLGPRTYEISAEFCSVAELCDSESRHIVVEVRHESEIIYTVETVFTRLR